MSYADKMDVGLDELNLDQLPEEMREQARQEKQSQGGFRYDSPADRAHIKQQRAAIWAWFRGLGGNLIKHGVNLTKVPLPVELCEPRSFLARLTDSWGYINLLHAAAACSDPVERLKLVVAFAVGGMRQQVSCDKPFNPILGETLQARYGCGCSVFAEQVSHHPPVSCWQVLDHGGAFEYTGSSCWAATFSGNSVKGTQSGDSRVRFASDGAVVTWTLPTIHIRGVLFGDRVVKYADTLAFVDDANELRCELAIDPHAPKRGLVKRLINKARHPRGKHSHDALVGELCRGKTLLDTCSGTWLTELIWDKGVRSTSVPDACLPDAAASAGAGGQSDDAASVVCHSIGSFSSSTSGSGLDAGEAAAAAGTTAAGSTSTSSGGGGSSAANGQLGAGNGQLTARVLSVHARSGDSSSSQPPPAAAASAAALAGPRHVGSAATLSSDATGHRSGRGISVAKKLWDAQRSALAPLQPLGDEDADLLPSDHRYRPDVQALAGGNGPAASRWKVALEERQRRDRALRAAALGHHHRRSSVADGMEDEGGA